jgi:hypothetical protein
VSTKAVNNCHDDRAVGSKAGAGATFLRNEVSAVVRMVTTFSPEDGDSVLLRNADNYRRVYAASNPIISSFLGYVQFSFPEQHFFASFLHNRPGPILQRRNPIKKSLIATSSESIAAQGHLLRPGRE